MVSRAEIQAYADKIAERFHPEKIILFGSYAYGTPTEDSDVDLLVIMDHDGRGWQKATEIRSILGYAGFAMDLIVRRRAHVNTRVLDGDPFYSEIVSEGKQLYADNH